MASDDQQNNPSSASGGSGNGGNGGGSAAGGGAKKAALPAAIVHEWFDAIRTDDHAAVRRLAGEHPELATATDPRHFGAPPITSVVSTTRSRDMIDLLIELGADLDQRSDWEMGPFAPIHSTDGRDAPLDLIRWLIERGATPDAHCAAGLGDAAMLRDILAKNPDVVHERGGDGRMPLHFARSVEVAEMLVEAGADMEARCLDHHSTAAQYAATNSPEVARFLSRRGSPDDLIMAAVAGDVEWMGEILARDPRQKYVRVNDEWFPAPEGFHTIYTFTIGGEATALHAAAQSDHADAVRWLVSEQGFDVNVRGCYDDATPLHMACWHGAAKSIAALVEVGADMTLPSGRLHTSRPMVWAIVNAQVDAARALLAAGYEPNEQDRDEARGGVDGGLTRMFGHLPAAYEPFLDLLGMRG